MLVSAESAAIIDPQRDKEAGMAGTSICRNGIVLAGGAGSRLHPATAAISKHLLPIHDKPIIYYPVSTLMLAGIREILLISTPQDTPRFEQLLEDVSNWGLNISYAVQPSPGGLAQAFLIEADFIGADPCALILCDDVFDSSDLAQKLSRENAHSQGATVFAHQVNNSSRFGVVELYASNKAFSIEEKPAKPKSRMAVTDLYFYDNRVGDITRSIKPSSGGELEITEVNRAYLEHRELSVEVLGRGVAWLDTGTHEALVEASNFVETLGRRQRLKSACPEEIAFRLCYIDAGQLASLAAPIGTSDYGQYIYDILRENIENIG